MKNAGIRIRWLLTVSLLRLARITAVKGCDYGNRVTAMVDDFLFYRKTGRALKEQK